MSKIVIVGAGTAGALTAAHFARDPNTEVEWWSDPNIKAQSVGEGSLMDLPPFLEHTTGFNLQDLEGLDGTIKSGIYKSGWAGTDFNENFSFGNHGMHFNAVKLQEWLRRKLESNKNVTLKSGHVSIESAVDSNWIIDCTGAPSSMEGYVESKYIPVNAAHVWQCPWDYAKFNHTLTIAGKHGWIFGIPLRNRLALGYMHNSSISSVEDLQAELYNLAIECGARKRSEITLKFRNYYRGEYFTNKIARNGNAAFFLEPLEATSLSHSAFTRNTTHALINNQISMADANAKCRLEIEAIECVIMMHYWAGSKHNTPFWHFAQERGNAKLESMRHSPTFINAVKSALSNKQGNSYGTWGLPTLKQNIINLGIQDKLTKLLGVKI